MASNGTANLFFSQKKSEIDNFTVMLFSIIFTIIIGKEKGKESKMRCCLFYFPSFDLSPTVTGNLILSVESISSSSQ